ncbi:MAG: hypothetical protein LBI95_03600 [Holosporales bacterium]|jgi:hypothetical protein|nr:hypothetical protein [Holosporales bacterium]
MSKFRNFILSAVCLIVVFPSVYGSNRTHKEKFNSHRSLAGLPFYQKEMRKTTSNKGKMTQHKKLHKQEKLLELSKTEELRELSKTLEDFREKREQCWQKFSELCKLLFEETHAPENIDREIQLKNCTRETISEFFFYEKGIFNASKEITFITNSQNLFLDGGGATRSFFDAVGESADSLKKTKISLLREVENHVNTSSEAASVRADFRALGKCTVIETGIKMCIEIIWIRIFASYLKDAALREICKIEKNFSSKVQTIQLSTKKEPEELERIMQQMEQLYNNSIESIDVITGKTIEGIKALLERERESEVEINTLAREAEEIKRVMNEKGTLAMKQITSRGNVGKV